MLFADRKRLFFLHFPKAFYRPSSLKTAEKGRGNSTSICSDVIIIRGGSTRANNTGVTMCFKHNVFIYQAHIPF